MVICVFENVTFLSGTRTLIADSNSRPIKKRDGGAAIVTQQIVVRLTKKRVINEENILVLSGRCSFLRVTMVNP